MGYYTDFEGSFILDKPLDASQIKIIKEFTDKFQEEYLEGWCHWTIKEDGTEVIWNGEQKFYDYPEWIHYLIKKFFIPWGFVLNGEVSWDGENRGDVGKIIVENNKVFVIEGEIVYPEENLTEIGD